MFDKFKFKIRQKILNFLQLDIAINNLHSKIDATAPNLLIEKVARFAACEMVEGDYLEFGVFKGDSLISAYKSFENQFTNRINQSVGGDLSLTQSANRQLIWSKMRFFGFDSFRGLPGLETDDQGTDDFAQGMYACSKKTVISNLQNNQIPLEKVHLVEGYFSESCTPQTRSELGITKAACVLIDGDLYSSSRDCLKFISPLLQNGTILIFDDWFSYRGNPLKGEQRAFNEWKNSEEIKDHFDFIPYHMESWKRASFIAVSKSDS